MHITTWHAELFVDEEQDRTAVQAVQLTEGPHHLPGRGVARLAPSDETVTEIRDEVAAAQALHALADALLETAADDLAAQKGRPDHLAVP